MLGPLAEHENVSLDQTLREHAGSRVRVIPVSPLLVDYLPGEFAHAGISGR